MEADFVSAYRLNLGECLWGPEPMGVRRLCALVQGLGPDSALARSLNPEWYWDNKTELLAQLVESSERGITYFIAANTPEGTDVGEPHQVPRPWDRHKGASPKPSPEPTKQSSTAEVKSFFGANVKVKPTKPEGQ